MRLLRLSAVLLAGLSCLPLQAATPIKVACVGDSVTWGLHIDNRETNSYPAQLQRLLGDRFLVENFGASGTTLLRKGQHPYAATDAFRAALAFRPDIVVIDLGLNDTDPRSWPDYRDSFAADYGWLIAQFRAVNPAMQIDLAILTPIFDMHPRFQSGTREWAEEIRQQIPAIAHANHADLIDFYTPLLAHPNLFPDALHPNAEGASILSRTVFHTLTGDYGGLQLPAGFGDHMVLPHDLPVPLRGRANRGEDVELEFAGREQHLRAGRDGLWSAVLPAQKPGGSYTLRLRTAERAIELHDITFGELWLCSGQSNMDFPLAKALGAAVMLKEIPSDIRLLHYRGAVETSDESWGAADLEKVNRLEYFSGEWHRADADTVSEFSAVGYAFALELEHYLHMPIGVVQVAVGGSNIESWIDRRTLENDPRLEGILLHWRTSDWIMPWCRQRADKNLAQTSDPLQRHPYEPAYNYEAGIERLSDLPIRGVLWYQGESNTHNPELYAALYPRLVESWRKLWKHDLPFFSVQISGMNRPSWPQFRLQQLELADSVPNTYLVVSSDLGEPEDVHYKRKFPVGQRLARLALQEIYPGTGMLGESPEAMRAKREGVLVRVYFRHTGGRLQSSDGGVLRGFVVRDLLGNWHSVDAKIAGDTVELRSPALKTMEEVAYAWEPLPHANLENAAGLPASTFRLPISNR